MLIPCEDLRQGDRVRYEDGWCEHSNRHRRGDCGGSVHQISWLRHYTYESEDGGISDPVTVLQTTCVCGCAGGFYRPGALVSVTKRGTGKRVDELDHRVKIRARSGEMVPLDSPEGVAEKDYQNQEWMKLHGTRLYK